MLGIVLSISDTLSCLVQLYLVENDTHFIHENGGSKHTKGRILALKLLTVLAGRKEMHVAGILHALSVVGTKIQ